MQLNSSSGASGCARPPYGSKRSAGELDLACASLEGLSAVGCPRTIAERAGRQARPPPTGDSGTWSLWSSRRSSRAAQPGPGRSRAVRRPSRSSAHRAPRPSRRLDARDGRWKPWLNAWLTTSSVSTRACQHHAGVPGGGQAEQALVATCGLVDGLHARRLAEVGAEREGTRRSSLGEDEPLPFVDDLASSVEVPCVGGGLGDHVE